MIKDKELIILEKIAGNGKVPVGFQVGGVYRQNRTPKVGESYRCGGFTTASVTRVDNETFDTEKIDSETNEITKSTYKIYSQEESGCEIKIPIFGKATTFFDSLDLDPSRAGFGIYEKGDDAEPLAEKMSSAWELGEHNVKEATRILLPTLTSDEVAFLVASAYNESVKQNSTIQSQKPKDMEELLKMLRDLKSKGDQ